MADSRRKEGLALGGAFVVGALLAGWLAWSVGAFAPEPSVTKRTIRTTQVEHEPLAQPRLRGQADSRAEASPHLVGGTQDPVDLGLTVLLRAGSRQHPVPVTSGTVAVIRRVGSGESVYGTVLRKDVALSRSVDDSGAVVLDPSSLPERGLICAMAPNLSTAFAVLPESRQGEIVLHLSETTALPGLVLTPDGVPVEGAQVLAGPPGTDIQTDDERIMGELSSRRSALSDARGGFSLEDLAPGARVRLAARKAGYAFSGVEVAGERVREPLVEAGRASLVVRMRPKLYGCFRGKSERTRRPITDQVLILKGLRGRRVARFRPGDSATTGGLYPFATDDPSLVQWTAWGVKRETIKLQVQLAGFEPTVIDATMLPLAEYLARQEEQVVYFRESEVLPTGSVSVRLEGARGAAIGSLTLVVRIEEDVPNGRGAPGETATARGTIGGELVEVTLLPPAPRRSVQGILQDDGSWLFSNVPSGRRALRLYDGHALVAEIECDLPPDQALPLVVPMRPFTGAALVFRSSDGQRLYGVRYTLTRIGGGLRPRPLRNHLELTSDGDLAPPRPDPLAPGRWQVRAYAVGFGQGEATFDVEESRVTDLEVTIEN